LIVLTAAGVTLVGVGWAGKESRPQAAAANDRSAAVRTAHAADAARRAALARERCRLGGIPANVPPV
jgi:hypothetical protein